MLKTIAIITAVVVAVPVVAILGYAATKPDTFRVQRSASIKAPPEKIFPAINDFRRWGSWSPYEKLDPDMKRVMSGAESGKGSVYEWQSTGKAGAGRMEITDASPPSKILLKLDFTKPMEAHNVVEFTLQPNGDATNVTWAMHGPVPYMAKVIHVFFDVDAMVGKDFETGLANLKTMAER